MVLQVKKACNAFHMAKHFAEGNALKFVESFIKISL